MDRLALIASILISAAPDGGSSPSEQCTDKLLSCREGCTLDFGTNVAVRADLGLCMLGCEERERLCLLRVVKTQPPTQEVEVKERAQEEAPEPQLDGGQESTVKPRSIIRRKLRKLR